MPKSADISGFFEYSCDMLSCQKLFGVVVSGVKNGVKWGRDFTQIQRCYSWNIIHDYVIQVKNSKTMVKSNYITEHRKGQHLLSEERMKSKGGLGIPQQAKIGSVSGF